MSLLKVIALVALVALLGPAARASDMSVSVAVAANFLGTLQRLAPLYERASGDSLRLSAGSSGVLAAQIRQGAPFDVFLSADRERPEQLETQGLAVRGSLFTYAIGTLVLWSPRAGELGDAPAVLRAQRYRFLAVADPHTAPYGAAAEQVLQGLHLWEPLQRAGKLVVGANINQTWEFTASGNAQLGFVALSQVIGESGRPSGSYWLPPRSSYQPIEQAAVVIAASAHRDAAEAFAHWLREAPAALAGIHAAGYGTPDERAGR